MKNFIVALTFCFLLGTFSILAPVTTAKETGKQQTVEAITQEPAGEGAKLVVEGPTKVKPGDLVVISVEQSKAASFKWIVLPSTNNFLVIDGGKRAVFSSGVGGDYKFIVACGLEDTCDVAVHSITVIGNSPNPTDNLPSKIALWCDQVESDTKREDAIKLAQSFSSVALVMDGGTLTTPSEIVKATFKSNQDALGEKLDNWLPFRNALAEELKKMSAEGKLPDSKAHVEVWKAIASALREYASTL